jgi:hypothetical protein
MASLKAFARATVLGLGLVAFLVPCVVRAQAASEAAEISACMCLQQAIAALSAEMNAKTRALDAVNRQFADLDAQLARERPAVNVNDSDSVAHYKALLERRDASYHQSIGRVHADATQVTGRYNARVNEYNARCANRPFGSALVAQVQTHLTCPPLQ